MKWADSLKFFLDLAEDGDTPKALRDCPELRPHLGWILTAFHSLSGDRHSGMSIAPIPFTAVDRYAARYGIEDTEEFEIMHRHITALDNAFLKFRADENPPADKMKGS